MREGVSIVCGGGLVLVGLDVIGGEEEDVVVDVGVLGFVDDLKVLVVFFSVEDVCVVEGFPIEDKVDLLSVEGFDVLRDVDEVINVLQDVDVLRAEDFEASGSRAGHIFAPVSRPDCLF